MESNKRLGYIDIAKAVLIICVVLGHIPHAMNLLGMDYPFVCYPLDATMFLYVGIYMQAFFLLSGYTSHFDKPFCTFLARNLKGILVPCLFLGPLAQTLNYILIGNFSVPLFPNGFLDFLFCDNLWFLWVMFGARLIYWAVAHFIDSKSCRGVAMMGILVVGIFLDHLCGNSQSYLCKNYCFYRTAMCLGVFLWLGDILKTMNLSVKVSLAIGFSYIPFIFISKYVLFLRPVSFSGAGGAWVIGKYHSS